MNKLKVIPLLVAIALTGCAELKPMKNTKAPHNELDAVKSATEYSKDWEAAPIFSEGKASIVIIAPTEVPESIRSKQISLKLEPDATVKDVVAILGNLGIPTIISNVDAGNKQFYMPSYSGTVGGFLAAVTRATDVWFTWEGDSILVSPTEKISVSIPQESSFTEQMTKAFTALGLTGKVDWQSGMATMTVAPSEFKQVKSYLEKATANAAIISLQLAVINVTLAQTAKQGIDWDKLTLSASNTNLRTALPSTTSSSTSTGSNTGNVVNGGANNVNSNLINTGASTAANTMDITAAPRAFANTNQSVSSALDFAGSALQGAIFTKYFNFVGLFNFLQTYGVTEARQNVMLKTFTGNKVALKSITKIPYVSGVGVSGINNTVSNNTTSGLGNNVLGSTQTANAEDGTDIEITPSFDAHANTVTLDLSVSIKSVVAFNELSAGNQIGKLTQPTTADRTFTDKVLMRPGQTAVVGGISFDNISDNRGGPLFLEAAGLKRLESQSLKVDRQTMFIVVRPTVMRLGKILSNSLGSDDTSLQLINVNKD